MNFLQHIMLRFLTSNIIRQKRFVSNQIGDLGAGAGKGGGGGGSIREAGGAFGKTEAAREEEYFYNMQKEQLQKLKSDLINQNVFNKEQIKKHQHSVSYHKQQIKQVEN